MAELQCAQEWVGLFIDFDDALAPVPDVDADFEAKRQLLARLGLVDVVHQDLFDDFVLVGVHDACILMNHNDYLHSNYISQFR
jgi:hypothetical protein